MADEFNFMQAAEKAIRDLRREVDMAKAAARKRTAWNVVLTGVVIVLLAVSGLSVSLWAGQRDALSQFRQQAVNSCQIGNDRAAGTVTALSELVRLLEGPHPTAKVQKEAAAYDAYVLAHNQQRDCKKAYSSGAGQ